MYVTIIKKIKNRNVISGSSQFFSEDINRFFLFFINPHPYSRGTNNSSTKPMINGTNDR